VVGSGNRARKLCKLWIDIEYLILRIAGSVQLDEMRYADSCCVQATFNYVYVRNGQRHHDPWQPPKHRSSFASSNAYISVIQPQQ